MSSENNGAHDTPEGEEKPLLSPRQQITWEDLERERRQRLCLALSIFCCACILVGGIGVWKLHMTLARDTAHYYTALATHALESIGNNYPIPDPCETTLLLFRHCDKDGPHIQDEHGNEHCGYLGYERAAYMATLFGPQARWPLPSHLFALLPERNSKLNYREYETLLPLSRKVNLEIDLARHPQLANEFLEMLATGDLCDKVTVVSWKHSYMVELAARLGCGPDNGCPSVYEEGEFDQLWQLKYVYNPPTSSQFDPDFSSRRRILKGKKSHRGGKHPNHEWAVYGTVSQMNFDPLSFSYQNGDYQGNGSGNWEEGQEP
jgi:hypothetical protein